MPKIIALTKWSRDLMISTHEVCLQIFMLLTTIQYCFSSIRGKVLMAQLKGWVLTTIYCVRFIFLTGVFMVINTEVAEVLRALSLCVCLSGYVHFMLCVAFKAPVPYSIVTYNPLQVVGCWLNYFNIFCHRNRNILLGNRASLNLSFIAINLFFTDILRSLHSKPGTLGLGKLKNNSTKIRHHSSCS